MSLFFFSFSGHCEKFPEFSTGLRDHSPGPSAGSSRSTPTIRLCSLPSSAPEQNRGSSDPPTNAKRHNQRIPNNAQSPNSPFTSCPTHSKSAIAHSTAHSSPTELPSCASTGVWSPTKYSRYTKPYTPNPTSYTVVRDTPAHATSAGTPESLLQTTYPYTTGICPSPYRRPGSSSSTASRGSCCQGPYN